ncbi:MAG TPA: HipA domain-containing protein [Xanthobacteraceae bacterium]|nr:HipA domain-containing protein [Xanthobacteraceae bacterium]
MATVLWGKVYYNTDLFAGELRQEPGGRCVFTYDPAYLHAKHPAVAFTLPLQAAPYICEQGLHPFFDNLVAEGWLRNAQARALKVDPNNRFALLLAFGRDCAGAVSVIDPAPTREPTIDMGDPTTAAALTSRASLSGVQPKLLAVKEGRHYRPARADEPSTHVAKLPSGTLTDIVENEYLTTLACRTLLPDDKIVDPVIAPVQGIRDRALIVRRFDRLPSGAKRHFEEFNQLLGRRSGDDKYDAAYDDMAAFIRSTPGCTPVDAWRLFRRVLVCLLTGNTDAHLKNFAMFHTPDGLRLTPAYDLVASALYPDYRQIALAIGRASNLVLEQVKPKHVIALSKAYGLDTDILADAVKKLDGRRAPAEKSVTAAAKRIAQEALGNQLVTFMEKRWNGSFKSIGRLLLKKRSAAGAT